MSRIWYNKDLNRSTVSLEELEQLANLRRQSGHVDYFIMPHGGRPPSNAAVHAATERYLKKVRG